MIKVEADSAICSSCRYVKNLSKFEKGRKQCRDCRKLYHSKLYKSKTVVVQEPEEAQKVVEIEN